MLQVLKGFVAYKKRGSRLLGIIPQVHCPWRLRQILASSLSLSEPLCLHAGIVVVAEQMYATYSPPLVGQMEDRLYSFQPVKHSALIQGQ